MSGRVFISHSSLDRAVADPLCAALEAQGIACWIAPRDIQAGAEWAEQIIDGIDRADVMLLVLSSHANASPQVRREVERAVHHQLTLLPVRVEDVQPSKGLGYFLGTQHWLDAHPDAIDGHVEAIAGRSERCARCVIGKTRSATRQPRARPRPPGRGPSQHRRSPPRPGHRLHWRPCRACWPTTSGRWLAPS